MGKLINKIPGSRLLISSLPGSASQCQQAFSKPCLVNLISKDTHLVFSIYKGVLTSPWSDLLGQRASNSSKNITHGAELRARWKTVLTAFSLSPTY